MKKGLALLLACLMTVCWLPAMAEETEWYNGLDFSEHVFVDYMAWSNFGLDGSDPVFKEIEKRFNMDFAYYNVPNGEYQTWSSARLSSGLATGEIPVMYKFMVPNVGGLNLYRQYQEDGLIVNISEYVDKYNFKNLKAILDSDWCQPLKEADGCYYQFPNKIGPSMQAVYVRQDWVDKLGLEAPKTWDDYKAYLKAMVDADLDGNGTTGLTLVGVGSLDHILSGFTGKSGNYVSSDGKWMHKSQAPGFKEGLLYLKDLYAENLLDPEFAIMTNNTIQEKYTSGRAASIILNGTAGWWGPMEVAMTAYKADAKMGALDFWPAGPAGEVKSGGANFFGTIVINSSASEAQIVRALALMDWIFTEDCYDLFYYGAEGWTYDLVNGERVIDVEKKKAAFNGKDLYQLYDLDNNVMQYRALTIEPLYNNFMWLADHCVFDEVVGLATDVTIEVGTAIEDVYNTWMVSFITGEKDIDADWDAYLADMNNAGLDRYLAEVEAYMAK